MGHHVLTALPGGQRLPLLAPAAPHPGQVAGAVAGYLALREFRARLYECLTSRADASFELIDAILCADHAVTSLVQLCLEPEFRRGHGALYDSLSAGRIDDERLFSLLAEVLPPLVDGAEALAWIAEHDVIDRGLLEEALAGLAPDDAARVRDACARWSRLRFAVDATAYPRPDAWCSPGREHVHNGACHCKGSSKTAPGWEYQFTAATGHLRTAWAALVDVARTTPATRTAQTITQVKNVLRRLGAAGHGHNAAPLFVFDAGYSAAALADGLLGCPAHILVRLAAGSVFYAEPVTWEGKYGRPPRRGAAVHCLEPADFAAAAAGNGPRGRTKPLPPNPEPDEELTLPDTPLYGTVRAGAWHGVHPLIHGDRGWFAGRTHLPVLPGTLVHVTVERLPDGRGPHRAMWLWHAGPGPLSLDELTRTDIEELLYREAELLDAWDLDGWLTLWAGGDTRYVVPCNDTPEGDPTQDLVLIDDDALRMRLRVERLNSRKAHREYPHSRTNHQVFNVRPGAVVPGPDGPELPVRASFTVWRFRNGRAVSYVGQYHYRLVVEDCRLKIRTKRAVLDVTELRPAGDLAIIL